ncbi:hypothetical protein M011DRAFT_181986 [Sporormia fimetaria CBS 119925]|uniref:Uncharacterized protein n=1 Tax=Sporormia fimetaria CBS 119925 TaxID=1340428 RepID=A0A6A6VLQ0_9PLEO|nr:hypothetical protein M011DRAFT_181986 [Sporormia fimetaria CBS 119925]
MQSNGIVSQSNGIVSQSNGIVSQSNDIVSQPTRRRQNVLTLAKIACLLICVKMLEKLPLELREAIYAHLVGNNEFLVVRDRSEEPQYDLNVIPGKEYLGEAVYNELLA